MHKTQRRVEGMGHVKRETARIRFLFELSRIAFARVSFFSAIAMCIGRVLYVYILVFTINSGPQLSGIPDR